MRDDASMNHQSLGGLVCALTLSSAVAAWWAVGDLSEPDLFAPDYMFEPPEISGGVEAAIGVVGCLVTAGILIALVRARAVETITRRQIVAVVPVVAIGVYVGFSWRVMTAAVSGANIGGALLMMAALVVVPLLAAVAYRLWSGRSDRAPEPETSRGSQLG